MLPKHQTIHKVQLTISVSEVHIEIKFPCKLQIGVKVDKDQKTTSQEVQLKDKQAIFSQKLKIQSLIPYETNNRKYLQKYGTITIYVVSPRGGKNIGGVLNFDISTLFNDPKQQTSFIHQKLQRCPDKQATISLKIKGILLQQISETRFNSARDGSGSLFSTQQKVSSTISDRLKIDSKILPARPESGIIQKRSQRNLSQHYKRSANQEVNLTPISQRIFENRNDNNSKCSNKEDSGLLSQNYKLKSKIDQLQREIQSYKKQLVDKKKLQNQVDSLSHKISELQKVVGGNRIQIDSILKEKKRESAQLSNRVEELQKLNVTLQKRVDLKNNFYKQQIEKYNSKLVINQNQKQRLTHEISTLKNQNFQLNRSINDFKDKEKVLVEDKLKLLKKIQDFKKQYNQKQSVIETPDKNNLYDRLKQTISNNEVQKISLVEELQKLKNQIVKESVFRTKYQHQLKEKSNIIQQKLIIENQYSTTVQETTIQINRLNKQLQEKCLEVQQLNNKITQFTNKNKIEVSKTSEEIQTLKSALCVSKQTSQRINYQYQQTNFTLQQVQSQLVQITKKCAMLQSSLKTAQGENQLLKKNIKLLSEQENSMRNQISKLNFVTNDFQTQLTVQTQEKRNNQRQFKELIQKVQATNKQLQKQICSLQDELYISKIQMAQQEEQFNNQMERKQRLLRQKQQDLRNILQQETRLQINNAQLQSTQTQLKQNLRILQLEINKEKLQNQNYRKINAALELSQKRLKQDLDITKNNLQQKQNQCESLNQSNSYLDNMLTSTKNQFERYKESISQHIHNLLKSLVTKNQNECIIAIEQLPQGLLKLQADVVNKVRVCYEQLEITTQKLIDKEMEFIHLEQNSNLQGNTLQIQLSQLRKQLQLLKQQKNTLSLTLDKTKSSLTTENESLKNKLVELQILSTQNLAHKIKQSNSVFEKQSERVKNQYGKEKKQFQSKIQELEYQLSSIKSRTSDQDNQMNLLNLKNYEYKETIKQLEERLRDGDNKEEFFEMERNKLMNDITYLDESLNSLSESYEIIKRNYAITLEKQAIIIEQNQYMRSQFENNSRLLGKTNIQFQNRERSVIQLHKSASQNNRLNEIIHQLETQLQQKQNSIKVLESSSRSLNDEIQENFNYDFLRSQRAQSSISNLSSKRIGLQKVSMLSNNGSNLLIP